MSSDTQLLERSLEGDKAAFASLVERYQNLVHAVTFGATGDRELAADVAQDTFLAAWTSLPKLRDTSRFRSWLCGIARNLVGKVQRKRQHHGLVTADLVHPGPNAENELADLETETLLREILAELDDSVREPLVLYYWEGRSTKGIAAGLGLSVSAVEQRLSRGRRRIKADIEERVDRALQSAKPDARFSAVVMAAIDVAAGPVAEKTGSLARVAKPVVLAAGVVALALGAWVVANPKQRDLPTTDRSEIGIPVAAAVREDDPQARESAAPRTPQHVTAGPPLSVAPDPTSASLDAGIAKILLMESFPNRVVVNLRGGKSSISDELRNSLEAGSGMPFNAEGTMNRMPLRTIAGTVTDLEGHPVAGAVVVAGLSVLLDRVYGVKGELFGRAGAITDADGNFSFEASTGPAMVTAVTGEHGFASPTEVAASDEGVELDMMLRGIAAVEGDLTYDGEAAPGHVVLRSISANKNTYLASEYSTDESGHYRISAVPPGPYLLFAAADPLGVSGGRGDTGPSTNIEVVLSDGKNPPLDFNFERGVTLELRATRPVSLAYYVFVDVKRTRWSDARELLSSSDIKTSMVSSTLDDDEAFGVIEGLPAKPMTVCAVRPRSLFEPSRYTECRVVPAPATADATINLTFDPPPD